MTNFTLTSSDQLPNDALDPLSDSLRSGAKKLIAQAVDAELQILLDSYKDVRLLDGRQAVVRNGYLLERTVQARIGNIEGKVPKVLDRSGTGVKSNASLLPPYLKRARSIEELIPGYI